MFRDHLSTAFDAFADLKFPVLVGGAAHCGKSNFVTECLAKTADVAVIGTATLDDRTFRKHLEGIQKNRPSSWETVNESTALAPALDKLARSFGTVIVDSLNQWVGNLLVESLKIHDPSQTIDALQVETNALMRVIEDVRGISRIVLVTSEVGACPAPPRIGERIFRQCLGQLNAALAKRVPTVIHIQYGLPFLLRGSAP
jgi:adenosylcobinamide kinase/adenosylcobinamide-phosphate guanylyltransferase